MSSRRADSLVSQEARARQLAERLATCIQGAELILNGDDAIATSFAASRMVYGHRGLYGTNALYDIDAVMDVGDINAN